MKRQFRIHDKVRVCAETPKFGWGGSLRGEVGCVVHIETISMPRFLRKPREDVFWVGVDFPNRRKYTNLCLAVEPNDLEYVED